MGKLTGLARDLCGALQEFRLFLLPGGKPGLKYARETEDDRIMRYLRYVIAPVVIIGLLGAAYEGIEQVSFFNYAQQSIANGTADVRPYWINNSNAIIYYPSNETHPPSCFLVCVPGKKIAGFNDGR